jgi:general stress protein YciG
VAGTRNGGIRAAATNRAKYGLDFYRQIGRRGGKRSRNGGFASDVVGPDGRQAENVRPSLVPRVG